jgi:subtilisin family serine protease
MFAHARQARLLLVFVALLGLFAALPAPIGAAAAGAGASPEVVPNQVVLGFEEGTTAADRDRIVAALGGRTLWELRSVPVRLVAMATDRVSGATALPPGLRYAEPNFVVRQQATPNDEYMQYLWGMHNTGQTIREQPGIADADVDAPEAWNTTTGSRNIVVAIVDSGIDLTHPDLVANMWRAPSGWSLPSFPACGAGTIGVDVSLVASHQYYDCAPEDENGHGTHVAGTVGAVGNNGGLVTGINWQTSMMILKHAGAADTFSGFNTAAALDYAIQAKDAGVNLRVINGSFGGGVDQTTQFTFDMISELNERDILFVAAAGNGGPDGVGDNNETTPFYPGSFDLPNMVTVAATDNRDQLGSFSNYGAQHVHLGAPGVAILSTMPRYPVTSDPSGRGFNTINGTSMASPLVAGAAALVLSAPGLGNLTMAQLRHRLVNCGDPIAALAGKTTSGKRLNVRKAIDGCNVTFSDVPTDHPYYEAITTLATEGVIRGYGNGRYGPGDTTLRAQMAVLLVRAMGWSGEQAENPFTDGGGIDPELWDAVAILAARDIARGYSATSYGPNNRVLQAQAISLIARTMVAQGYWEYQPDNPALYTAVPVSAGHRIDLATFVHYAGALPDVPTNQSFAEWNQAATRGWFARALWQALDSHFGR